MILECINVKKEYQLGKNIQEVLTGVNLQVNANDFITIMGKSGCGKTTLLNCISLLVNITSGEIQIDEKDINNCKISDLDRIRQKKIGMVFQNANLISCLSSLDNIVLAMHNKLSYQEKKKKVMMLLEEIKLQSLANIKVTKLSGGERQRIAILRAVVNNPEIVICDEPTGALNAETSKDVIEFLIRICQIYNSALIIVTHDSQIGELGKRQFIMKRGILNEKA